MPIQLDDPQSTRPPVVKRTAIGQRFVGCLVNKEQRDVIKDGGAVLNDKGKPRQELVLTCLAMPGTTAPAGLGDNVSVPEPGDLVRLILRGKSFAEWIEQTRDAAACVGDIISQTTDTAQAYDANGAPKGSPMTRQADIDALPRSTSVGIYGPLSVRRPEGDELAEWVPRAEAAYHEATKVVIDAPAPAPAGQWDEDPF